MKRAALACVLVACTHLVQPGAERASTTGGDAGTVPAAIDASMPIVADAAPARGFVHVKDGELVDATDQPLLLRAIDVGNWLVAEGYMWKFEGARGDRARRIEARVEELLGPANAAAFWRAWRDAFLTEDDVAKMRELGFNAVRVALSARLLLPEGQAAWSEDGFATLQKLVAACERHGLYVIFDMHAAPGGQTGANIDDGERDAPELFTVPENQDRLVALWTEIARRFAESPTVVAYDLLNEPIAPKFAAQNAKLWPLYERVGAAIRGVDRRHVLIVEGAGWANDWSSLRAPFDDDMIYSFHKYWDDPTQASIQKYLDARALYRRPVWVGETGENKDAWYSAAFPMFEKNRVGWGFWTWKKLESDNNPYAVVAPAGWSAIQVYVRDGAPKPTAAAAQATFDELVENARLARCRFNRHAVCAVLGCE